jgi:hypothetical protein
MKLRDYVEDAGPGFCCESIPGLFPAHLEHSPLLVALDTNITIDLATHLNLFVDSNAPWPNVDEEREDQLICLGNLLNMWFMRDIRFVVLPKSYTDSKRPSATEGQRRRLEKRGTQLQGVNEALLFQLSTFAEELEVPEICRWQQLGPRLQRELDSMPGGNDRQLVLEAIFLHVDVFLTNDKGILRSADHLTSRGLTVTTPSALWNRLVGSTSGDGKSDERDRDSDPMILFTAGRLSHINCPYGWDTLAGDMGKWFYLLEALEN